DGVTTTYGYDAASELTTVNGEVLYTYDPTGNRTMAGYQTGPGNQLLSDGTWDYSYDGEGNLVAKVEISDGLRWDYGYDNAKHLTSAVEHAADGTTLDSISYSYDVNERRLSRAENGGFVGYGYDPAGSMWVDVDASSQAQMRRLFGDGPNQPLVRLNAASSAWYRSDHLGSIRRLTDNSGTV